GVASQGCLVELRLWRFGVASQHCFVKQFAAWTNRALGLPQRGAAVVAERVQRADVGEGHNFVAPQTRARDELVERAVSAFPASPLRRDKSWIGTRPLRRDKSRIALLLRR